MRIKLLLGTCSIAILLLVGCSSSGSSDSPDTSASSGSTDESSTDESSTDESSTDESSTAPKSVDACALADPNLISALGVAGEGEATDRGGQDGPPDIAWNVCTWGSLTDDSGLVTVQVLYEGPEAVINPLEILLSNSGGSSPPATPVEVGSDGQLYDFALITGGGGVGKTIGFMADERQLVAVSQTGEDVDVAALTALAQGVDDNL
ncbi:MAG: hypothetical protein WD029_09500 [Microthrixaceae bacterium]